MDEPRICKDCAHYHDEIAELPMLKRLFAVRTIFSETCDHPKFRDAVDGAAYPCVTARLRKCNGLPPLFADKRPNAKGVGLAGIIGESHTTDGLCPALTTEKGRKHE